MSRKRDLQRLNDYHRCTASLGNEGSCYRHKLTGLIYGPKARWA